MEKEELSLYVEKFFTEGLKIFLGNEGGKHEGADTID